MAAGMLGSTVLSHPAPRLIWNASASSPLGLYSVSPADRIRRGEMAVAWPPVAARELAAARRYLPRDVPLVKQVAGVADDEVCAIGAAILIGGEPVARRREQDPSGRPMPWWSGCRRLRDGELFLLAPDKSNAFDGRYFGVTGRELIVGRARLLWAR